ncbi:MAG: tRNA-intron lyase [Candidatus Aenigmarchaeota archaeon]|nr:tRNA-intron lyase [Candidatus Aenigmarchaeota archaeon]
MLRIEWDPKEGIWAEDSDSIEKLQKNFFGEMKGGKLFLEVEDALYVLVFQNGKCFHGGQEVGFDELANHYAGKEERLFIKFNAYRDWRDRGLILKRFSPELRGRKKEKASLKKYPAHRMETRKMDLKIYWHGDSFFSIAENEEYGRELFAKYWFGQWGVYRQERGGILKLDFLETIFLAKHFGVEVIDAKTGKRVSHNDILQHVTREREYAKQLYEVYEDWRLRGYVIKTGFKFGSHFRIYFPGASPVKQDKWIHSKHVLHVFPKEQKMLVSEWARAVRVAHSVKKTFLLSIPEMAKEDYVEYPAYFIAYRRKQEKGSWVRETPEDKPRYLMVAVSEDEHIGGVELASLLKKAADMGLELLLSITDRETSITYYVLKKILLPESDESNEYYEIEWMKP